MSHIHYDTHFCFFSYMSTIDDKDIKFTKSLVGWFNIDITYITLS